ncbi:MAG TPA: hypothetical protein PK902_09725 [Actinomycetota bacterium]|jgi:hypothetical protein|nr:hypothetical protein [Actinomycetota bacterium]
MSITRKVLAVGTTAALAGGALFMGAGAATAANDPGFTKVKAPKTVTAGQTFIIKCKLDTTANNWTGADAELLEKGATINAHRTVSSNGDCSMHVVLNATGKRKIRVVVEQNLGAIQSKWLTINVKPAS